MFLSSTLLVSSGLKCIKLEKGSFVWKRCWVKVGHEEEKDHLARASEVEEKMEPGRASEHMALKRCNTLRTRDIQGETTKGQEIFESTATYRHMRSMGRGDRSRPMLRKSLFLFLWV